MSGCLLCHNQSRTTSSTTETAGNRSRVSIGYGTNLFCFKRSQNQKSQGHLKTHNKRLKKTARSDKHNVTLTFDFLPPPASL